MTDGLSNHMRKTSNARQCQQHMPASQANHHDTISEANHHDAISEANHDVATSQVSNVVTDQRLHIDAAANQTQHLVESAQSQPETRMSHLQGDQYRLSHDHQQSSPEHYDPYTYQARSDTHHKHYRQALLQFPAQIVVDMHQLRDNMRALVNHVQRHHGHGEQSAQVMGVVKANGYGHGLLASALAALAGGASWLGTAQPSEALQLRASGISPERCHILTWLYDWANVQADKLIDAHIDISVGSIEGIQACVAAAERVGKSARLHVKIDTGFGRNGFNEFLLDDAILELERFARRGLLEVVAVWSHLAVADEPDNAESVEFTYRQYECLQQAKTKLVHAGFTQIMEHIASSAATLRIPQLYGDLVRPGIAFYGYAPSDQVCLPCDLQPALTLQAQLSTVKPVKRASFLSYGRTYQTRNDTTTAIVPIGYGDGIHRAVSGHNLVEALGDRRCGEDVVGAPVRLRSGECDVTAHVSGRVCMDQFIVDLHGSLCDLDVHESDTAILFGPQHASPRIEQWAHCAGTISYEILTSLSTHIPRLYWRAQDVLDGDDLALLDADWLI